MRAEDLKELLRGVIHKENTGEEGVGDSWRMFIALIHTI